MVQQKTRDEIAKEQALAKYSAQLEQRTSLSHNDSNFVSFVIVI